MAEQNSGFEREREGANCIEHGRRDFLRQTVATVAALVFKTVSAETQQTKSLLPEGVEIRSVADLERLIETLLPAVREDFATQDARTETLKKETGNDKAKAPPVNGERFLASAKDLAKRIQHMVATLPGSKLDQMDTEIDGRFRAADKRLMADFSSKQAALDEIKLSQLSSLSLMVPRVLTANFWERMDQFDTETGARSNRVPPTLAQDRTPEQRGLHYVAAIIKGYQSIVEWLEKYHHRNPEEYGKNVFVLTERVDAPFSLVSNNNSRPVSLAKP